MFQQTIYPEGYNYTQPTCSKEELLDILYEKMFNDEIAQGKLVYLDPNFSYGIIYFGSEVYGHIDGENIRDFRVEYSKCLLNQIINVKLIDFDQEKQKFICSRKEIVEEARKTMDTYKIGFHLICKFLVINSTTQIAVVDIGNGRTVKVPFSHLDRKDYKPGDIATFIVKGISKSRMSKHQIITLTMKKGIGTIVPITFKYKKDNSWYGLVEGDEENYPIGEIQKLHQNAIYEKGDCHIARVSDYNEYGKPIYKLI